MIDLEKQLPTTIRCGGEWVRVKTDFRVWMAFTRFLREKMVWKGVFENPEAVPEGWEEGALEFWKSENPVPRGEGGERVLDYVTDSDLLVGAFWQAYGIDLTTADLHWHVFLALLRSLPSDTKLVEVMGYRSWTPGKKKPDEVYRELKRKWDLEEVDEEFLKMQQEAFGNA